VSPAAHRQRDVVLAGEVHRGHDIRRAGGLDDERGRLLDEAVPQSRRLVEAGVAGRQQRPAQAHPEFFDRLLDTQRAHERLGLLDRRVVRAVLDHVQRPAVARARRLGHRHRRREVVASPDQRGGDGDVRQIRRCGERRQEGAERRLHARRAGSLDVVGPKRLPALVHALAQAVQVGGAVLPQAVVRELRWVRQERVQRPAELRRRIECCEAERVDEHQAADPVGMLAGEACGDRPAQRLAHQQRRRRARALDQLAEPRQHALRVEIAVDHDGVALAGEVGGDHAVACRERRDDAQPVGGVAARPVEQDDRRPRAALQYDGRHAGEVEPSLDDGQSRQQALARVGRREPFVGADVHADNGGAAAAVALRTNDPIAQSAGGYLHPGGAQTSSCS
jgi:hypothetical protein